MVNETTTFSTEQTVMMFDVYCCSHKLYFDTGYNAVCTVCNISYHFAVSKGRLEIMNIGSIVVYPRLQFIESYSGQLPGSAIGVA